MPGREYTASMSGMATAKFLHTVTGLVEELDEDLASAFPQWLKRVDDDAKSFVKGMFTSGTVEEFDAAHGDGPVETTSDPAESDAPAAIDVATTEPAPTVAAPAAEGDVVTAPAEPAVAETTPAPEGN